MMGKPFSVCWKRRNKRKITLLMLGLDNAGKTTAINNYLEESTNDVVPTVGFSSKQLEHKMFDVTIYDLGGGNKIRDIWRNYYALVHGIVFVVDSSDGERLSEGRDVIRNVIQDSRISGKPILLLVNKQDVEGALNEVELCTVLELETLVNAQRCPTRIETCSAIGINKNCRDKGIETGFKWLLSYITKNYEDISWKVDKEAEDQRLKENKDREERMERIKKIREEREKLEQINENNADDSGEALSNPFRPISEINVDLKNKDKSERKSSVGIGLNSILNENKSLDISESQTSTVEADDSIFSSNEGDSEATVVLRDSSPRHDKIKHIKKNKKKRFLNKVDPLNDPLENDSISRKTPELPPLIGSSKKAWALANSEPITQADKDENNFDVKLQSELT